MNPSTCVYRQNCSKQQMNSAASMHRCSKPPLSDELTSFQHLLQQMISWVGWKFSVTPPHAVLVNGPRCDSGTHCSFSGRSRRRRDRRGCSGVCGPNVAINDILTTRKVTTCLHSLNSLQKRSIVKKIINEGPWLMTFSLTWCF